MIRSNPHDRVVKDLFSITTIIDKDAISNAESMAKILLILQAVLYIGYRSILRTSCSHIEPMAGKYILARCSCGFATGGMIGKAAFVWTVRINQKYGDRVYT